MLARNPRRSDSMRPSAHPRSSALHMHLPTSLEGTHAPIPGRDGTGTSPYMGPRPSIAGQFNQCCDNQWSGTLQWQCDGGPTLSARALTRDHLGDQCACSLVFLTEDLNSRRFGSNWPKSWPNIISLKFTPSASALPIMEFQEWVKKTKHVGVRLKPAFAADGDSFGLPMLVDWLKEKKCVRVVIYAKPSLSSYTFGSTQLLAGRFKATIAPRRTFSSRRAVKALSDLHSQVLLCLLYQSPSVT